MTRRLKLMLAVLAAVAVLVLFDRPEEAAVAEVSEGVPRPARRLAQETPPAPAPVAPLDAPIPDLFAGVDAEPAAPQAQADAAQPEAQERPAKPFTLLGFRQEGPVREAYLMQGNDVAAVRVGDVLDKRYRVVALGGDSVDIKDKQSGAAIRIGFEDHQ